MARLAVTNIVHPRYVKSLGDPRTSAATIRRDPTSAVVFLLLTLAVVNGVKSGQILPTAEQGFHWIGAALALVVVAHVAPDLVTYSLALVLLYTLLFNEQLVGDVVGRFTQNLQGA